MWGWISCLAVWLCLLGPSWGWSEPLVLIVSETVIVHGPQITIGDVAQVQGADARTSAEVSAIVIGQSPPAGEERVISSGYIITRLKQFGVTLDQWELRLPEQVRVTRAFQWLPAKEIEAAVQREIKRQMPWEQDRTTIQEIQGVEAVTVPPGAIQVEVLFPGHTDFLGRVSFSALVRVDGNIEKRLHGRAQIETLQDIVVTVRPLAKDDVITQKDVSLKQIRVSRLRGNVINQLDAIMGKRVRRPLRANTRLRAYDLDTRPLVNKGDVVLIVIDSKQLRLSVLGEALEPGEQGQTIRLRNSSSKREVRGVVIDSKTAQVPF